MSSKRLDTAYVLSFIVACLMDLQAALGLIRSDLYRDVAWARNAWFGNDLVTLVLATPLLFGAIAFARRTAPRARLLWLGMMAYAVYNYAYYMLGAALNVFFPLYVAAFVLSGATLIVALPRLDVDAIASAFPARAPVRVVGGYFVLVAVGLSAAWIGQWLSYVLTGRMVAVGADAFRLVAALDLSLMCTAMAVGGVLLWRRRPWGFVIASMAGFQGGIYTLALAVSAAIGARAGLPGMADEVPVWTGFTVATTVAMILLLGRVRPIPGSKTQDAPGRALSLKP